MSQTVIGLAIVALTFSIYIIVGYLARTKEVDEFYVAGRKVPAVANGMATAADWMSAASFISMAGNIFALGYEGLAYIMGWTGGYVLLALLLAPYIRKFGKFTIPDFVGERYYSQTARVVAVFGAIIVSFTYLIAQVAGVGIVMGRLLGIDFRIAIFVGLGIIVISTVLGGMKGITWTQVAQYSVLIIAYLIPITAMSVKVTGVPLPQLMYGQVIDKITVLEQQLNIKSYAQPFNDWTPANFLALTFVLMVGTAGLPHIIMRFYTVPSVRAARYSAGWALFFIFLLYFSAPAYAAFARYTILTDVIGKNIAALPSWVASWTNVGLLTIVDTNGDGILQWADLRIHNDIIVLATPEIAGLPYVVAALVAAGGLAAALSTADGLLMVVSSAMSHDIYYRVINPNATAARRLLISRILIVAVAAVAAFIGTLQIGIIVQIVAWAFSLAAASFFPVLLLGIWWTRATKEGAIAGLILGLAVTVIYIVVNMATGFAVFGIRDQAAGLFGMIVNFVAMYLISLATPEPSHEIQEFVHSLRYPSEAHPEKRRAAVEPAPASGN